jgi:hypothetical protein
LNKLSFIKSLEFIMQQISLLSGLSSALNLKANLGVQIKVPALASVNLKAPATTPTSHKAEVKNDVKAEVKTEVKAEVKAEIKAPIQEKAPAPQKMVEPAHQETVKVLTDVKAQAEVKLKEILTAPIKAEVKAQASAVVDLLKDIKLGAYANKPQAWEADKGQFHAKEDKGFEKTEKVEKALDWKEAAYHKGGDTLDLSKLKINLEGHAKVEGHAYQAVHQENAWQGHETNQYAHTQAWDAHGEAHVELTGQVQHHDHVMHA